MPELPPSLELYHLDEEVADLLQDDDGAGRRAVVAAVSPDQAEGAQRPVHVGLQLREWSPVTAGPWLCQRGSGRAAEDPHCPQPAGLGATASTRTRRPSSARLFCRVSLTSV